VQDRCRLCLDLRAPGGHFRDATMIRLAYRYGLRAKEVVELPWTQIDLDEAVISIKRARAGKWATICSTAMTFGHCGGYAESTRVVRAVLNGRLCCAGASRGALARNSVNVLGQILQHIPTTPSCVRRVCQSGNATYVRETKQRGPARA
jgi:hypothetical protein